MESIVIDGVYGSTFYRDKKTGKCAFTIQSTQNISFRNAYGSINCLGYIPVFNKGMPVTVTGVWEQNYKGAYYLNVSEIENITENPQAVVAYLKNSAFAGIGEKMASNIVNYTGCDIYSFVKEHDNAEELLLSNVKGITQERIHNMIIQLSSTKIQQEIYSYIRTVGADFEHVDKIFSIWAENSVSTLKTNPFVGYKANMDFYMCDALAKQEEKSILSNARIKSIIYTVLNQMSSSGSTYMTIEQLLKEIKKIETKSVYTEHLSPLVYCRMFTKMKNITLLQIKGEPCITLTEIYKNEKEIIRHLTRLDNSKTPLPFKREYIEKIEKKNKIQYGNSQKEAFEALTTSGVKIITGGPGTGKTTTIRGFIDMLKIMFPEEETVLLMAPTGRASQRMKETTNQPASTIHKGLDYKPFGDDGASVKNENNPLNARFIIIDEMSMIDTELMAMLLTAIQNGSLLLLFGDPNQLPSVGAGNVLHDLLEFEDIPCYKLTDIYRQKEDSGILTNVHLIEKGDVNLIENKDFHIIRTANSSEINGKIQEIALKYYDSKNPYNLQILSPIRKHMAGVFQLNKGLQKQLNPIEGDLLYSGVSYRMNDKVIFLQNNYKLGYFNGDIGTIVKMEKSSIDVLTNGEIITVPHKNLNDLMLAYAVTIHKSQGSEFPVCIIALPKSVIGMLDRNLLFTAVTRASKEVYVLSEEDALEIAINTVNISKRISNLANIKQGIVDVIYSA